MSQPKPFNPALLPPRLDYEKFLPEFAEARGKLGEFNGALGSIKNPELVSAPLITKEAVFSSQIEGTQATLEDVYQIEAGQVAQQGTEIEKDVQEIANYREAIKIAIRDLKKLPISSRLIKTLHDVLLNSVRGSHKDRGNFRKIQVFIGPKGGTISKATFVPPEANEIPKLLTNWENYIHRDQEKDSLIVAGIAHYQFEAIHPFLDGNGRIGRILIPLILYEKGLLRYPSLFISEYFEEHRSEYYRLLNQVSGKGDFTGWMQFFLRAIAATSERAFQNTNAIHSLYDEMLPVALGISGNFGKAILDLLFDSPIISFMKIKKDLPDMNAQTVYNLLNRFEEKGILKEITGRKRGRIYRFDRLLHIIQ